MLARLVEHRVKVLEEVGHLFVEVLAFHRGVDRPSLTSPVIAPTSGFRRASAALVPPYGRSEAGAAISSSSSTPRLYWSEPQNGSHVLTEDIAGPTSTEKTDVAPVDRPR